MDWLRIQYTVNNKHYTELVREKKASKVRKSKCGWCGREYVKTANKQKYCSPQCRKDARSHQSRMKSHRYYHKHKHEMNEKQRWGLGSGVLGAHAHNDYEKEQRVIQNELRRLGLKRR